MDTNVRTNYLTRALSLLLAIVMAFSSIPLFHIEADAATANNGIQEKLDALKAVYPTGSYFTANGQSCTSPHTRSYEACNNCNLKNIPPRGGLPAGKAANWSANSCCAFAYYVSYYLYGKIPNGKTGYPGFTKVSKPSKGDILWNGSHWAIFLYADSSGNWRVYDSNSTSKSKNPAPSDKFCRVAYDTSYDKSGATILHADNYDSVNKTSYSVTSSVKSTDNVSATLTVKLNVKTTASISYYISTSNSFSGVKAVTPVSKESFSTKDITIKDLKAGTKYYYKVVATIGGKEYSSSSSSFTTTAVKPKTTTLKVSGGEDVIGIGGQVKLFWDSASGAKSYKLTVTNPSGTSKDYTVNGLTYSLSDFTKSGTYKIKLSSVNEAGSTACNTVSVEVKPDVKVTFYDSVAKKNIETKTAHYGGSVVAPKPTVHEGHTFAKWDKSLEKLTSDITVNAIYDLNSYTVKFVDTNTNQVKKTQTVKYKESATAPTISVEDGYTLSWDKSFSSVKSDMTVNTVYTWTDPDNTASVKINSVKRDDLGEGYNVNITIDNKDSKILSGRAVAVLKSANNVVLASIESSAFALDKATGDAHSKTMTVYVPYGQLADKVQVYIINGYEALGQVSKVAIASCDNSVSSEWSSNVTYKTTSKALTDAEITAAVKEIKEKYGYSEVSMNSPKTTTKPSKTYYRYKTKTTTTSKSTSLSGYTQDGYSLVDKTDHTLNYVSSWPSGFYTSNTLYKQYNVSPKSASDTSTQKTVINSTKNLGYIYWHWCRGDYTAGPINRMIEYNKTSTFDTFHAFYSTTAVAYNAPPTDAYKYSNASACKDTYWWNGLKSGSAGLVTVKQQSYTTYNKLYNYYKISGYSDWIEYTGTCPVKNGSSAGTNATYTSVETKTVAGETSYAYTYKYKTSTTPKTVEPTYDSNRVYTLSGNVGAEFAGKQASIWVYKYTQASDFTLEYVGTITNTVSDTGEVKISNAVLLETPTIETGDFTIVAAVAGQDRAIEIGKIEAPKPSYTVTFYDSGDASTRKVISTQTVKEGQDATPPSTDLLKLPEGQVFTNWSESTKNVRSDMNVFPETMTETYTVAFVDWNAQSVELKKFNYGDKLTYDKTPKEIDGYMTDWVINIDDKYVSLEEFNDAGKFVTSDMVVETRNQILEHIVTVLDVDIENPITPEMVANETVDLTNVPVMEDYSVDNGAKFDFTPVLDVENSLDYYFLGWYDADTGEQVTDITVTEAKTIYPVYTFNDTVSMVDVSLETGEYASAQTVTLTCETDKATIWYTLDGTDPKTSETATEYTGPIVLDGGPYILRAYACKLAWNDSIETRNIYAINTGLTADYHVITFIPRFDKLVLYAIEMSYALVKDGRYLPANLFGTSIEGYTFDRLYIDEACTQEFFVEDEVIDSSMTVYALYNLIEYIVEYYDYNDAKLGSEVVAYGLDAEGITPPARTGYVFTGWDVDITGVKGDLKAKAQYIPESEYATISFTRTKGSVTVGQEYKLNNSNLKIEPFELSHYEIVWSSDNEAVATVDENGVVTGISEGTAVITAKLPYTGSIATYTVTVKPDYETSITLLKASSMGFDSERNLRNVPQTTTVDKLINQFDNDNELVFKSVDGKVLANDAIVGTGCTVNLYDGDKLLDSVVVIVTGDYNGDGSIDNKDVVMIQQKVLDMRDATLPQQIAIDVNGDGYVNNRDCSMLSQYLVGKVSL